MGHRLGNPGWAYCRIYWYCGQDIALSARPADQEKATFLAVNVEWFLSYFGLFVSSIPTIPVEHDVY